MAEMLQELRALMEQEGLAAYFLPNNDPHSSEYLSEHDKRMPFLSGFKGSNGQMLITMSEALLWTDGRYWLAAEQELYEGWRMMKMKRGEPTYFEWLVAHMDKDAVIGFDPQLVCADAISARTTYFAERGLVFKPLERNLVNEIWSNRPSLPMEPVYIHDWQYHEHSISESIGKVRSSMPKDVRFLLTSVLDEIAWLLNLRGRDIEYNPVFMAYLFIELTEESHQITLFVKEEKVKSVLPYLQENKVQVKDYYEIGSFLESVEETVLVDGSELNFSLYSKLKKKQSGESVIAALKAVKNPRELRGFRECHIRDAVALTKYFAWLRHSLILGEELTEYSAVAQLDYFRSQEALNMGLSFENISSIGPNAAVIHYAPTAEKASRLNKNEIYLLDSGGQYLDGTVDTTRTFHFGRPSEWERECYTRVLLGNLDVERAIWPIAANTTGNDLDVLARRWLWEIGKDYQHGTGHGVGHFLNVHEGPHYLGKGSTIPYKAGMVVTDEPGYYEQDAFGIRIENLLIVVPANIPDHLTFENVTMVPYDKNLIVKSLITEEDRAFINAYHQKVWNTLHPILEERGETLALSWLREATIPI